MDIKKHKYHRDWSGLPENVLATISDKLSLCEFLPLSNVCKPWRSFQKETLTTHRNPLRGFPWLVMSKGTGSGPKRCFSALENKVRKIKMPKADGGLIWGSFEDWLVIAKSLSDEPDQIYICI
ncbi:hypothetical protein Dsin_022350 [Dipteronia sinensis]|uniref:F-box domain-containing protein n=1 Tax=Dipteronia sinensis TaxID=43782 RepID=A0AAE0A1S8_9ROSI|nr:hypothetical protein Dsin_022350 [Dipteronia sinensis]